MSWIDPEKIMTGLMKSMGVSPQDFVNFLQTTQREFAEMRADRLAFKPASIRVVTEMNARMDRIEAKLDKVLALCEFNLLPAETHDGEPVNEPDNRNGSTGGH